MISTQHHFLFIHIPKTGGNSLQSVLLKHADESMTPPNGRNDRERFGISHPLLATHKHSSLNSYFRVLNQNFYQALYKFTSIRNPWDRCISLYFSPHREVDEWNRKAFVEFVERLQPTRFYVRTGRTGRLFDEMDFLIRFEHLQDDFDKLCDKLGLPREQLPHWNASNRLPYARYLDDQLRDLVAEKFREDIEIGGYQF